MKLRNPGLNTVVAIGVRLALFMGLATSVPIAVAQTPAPDSKPAEPAAATDTKSTDAKPAHTPAPPRGPESIQTFFLNNIGRQNDLNDIQTALRNTLTGRARLYAVPMQNAITVLGTAEELATSQKLIADLDRPRKLYRLTYTVTESDGGKRIGVQHFAMVIASGEKTGLKQGSRVPIVTGATGSGSSDPKNYLEYLDVGLEINASVENYGDGIRLNSKVSQSSIADEKSGVSAEDPVIRQTTLEGTSTLSLGKALSLGSLDVPGSTRHQDIEVQAELLH